MKYKFLLLGLVILLLLPMVSAVNPILDNLNHELIRGDIAGKHYTPICNTNCDLPIKFSIDLPMSIQLQNGELVKRFTYGNNAKGLVDSGIDILVEQEYKQSCNLNQVANGSLQIECLNDSNGNITIDNSYWTPLTFPFQFDGQKDYYFNLWGEKDGSLQNTWVDAIPEILGYQLPYAYWNSSVVQDTWVWKYLPNEAHGSDVDLSVGLRGDGGSGDHNQLYIQWNLTEMNITKANVSNANFTLYHYLTPYCTTTWNFSVFRVTSAWSEATTWNTKPTNDTKILGSWVDNACESGQPLTPGNVTFGNSDFTNVVNGWINGSLDNNGIVVLLQGVTTIVGEDWRFNSSEAGNSAPYLAVNYEVFASITDVSLNSPADNSYNNTEVTFNCSATDDTQVDNITLFIDGVENFTQTGSSPTLELNKKVNLTDGAHLWNCRSYNSGSSVFWGASNYTINVDSVYPVPYIINPSNDSEQFSFNPALNVTLNFSYTHTGSLSGCWYDAGSGNVSITCGTNSSLNFSAGSNTLKYYVNDSAGNWNYTAIVFSVNYLQGVFNISSSLVEGEPNPIVFNLTATNISSIVGNLTFNNTIYEMNISNTSTQALFTTILTAPAVPSDSVMNLWTNFTLNNGYTFGYATTQTIQNYYALIFNETTCPTGYTEGLHLNWNDEGNRSVLPNITMDYLFRYGVYNNTFETINGTLTNIENAFICFNNSQIDNYSIGYGEVQYRKTNWVDKRFYVFEGTILNNITKNYTLSSLLATDATSFLFTTKYTTGDTLVNKYLGLLRWYPSTDQYINVGMGRTDEKGQSVLRVETEDADYRMAVYEENGSLIYLADPIRMLCLTSPCTYTLNVDPGTADYLSSLNVQSSLTFDSSTNIILFSYNDASGDTSSMNLQVYKEGGVARTLVCNTTATGATGVITCDVTGQTGNLRAIVYRTASPLDPINSLLISLNSSVFNTNIGLFITAVLLIFVALTGIISPYLPIIFGVLAFIPAVALGVISAQMGIMIMVLGGLVIHFLNRAK